MNNWLLLLNVNKYKNEFSTCTFCGAWRTRSCVQWNDDWYRK